jgi:hypothetical protein
MIIVHPPCSLRTSSRVTFDGGTRRGAPTMRAARSSLRTLRKLDGWSARGAPPLDQRGARLARRAAGLRQTRSRASPAPLRAACPTALAPRPALYSRRGGTPFPSWGNEKGTKGVHGASPPRAMTHVWLATPPNYRSIASYQFLPQLKAGSARPCAKQLARA